MPADSDPASGPNRAGTPRGGRAAEGTATAATGATSATSGEDSAPREPSASLPAGAVIGHYTISGVLGQGGMGTVYRAQQDQPRRTVALKLIRAGYLSPALLRRFEHESQVLGRLQHPGIAQVYEAGTVRDDRGLPVPFFAMEFIEGEPLTDHASARRLGTRERLELVARICDAVDHAHQKGVIHRDLKPGNILVDRAGQPKILDFGVARATDSDVQQTTMQTDIGQLIGTVPYMSPEQVSGDPGELDTRSDVYALGVIAYELLAGRLPHDLSRRMIHEAVRVIREEEPTRLSSINRTLRGDIETIVAKALEKDKARRYQSAAALAADIRCFLSDQPIAARPASTWYQAVKFSRRNRGLVAGLAAAFCLLVAGLIGTSYGLVRADEQRRAAEANSEAEARARARTEAINAFVSEVLQSSDPERGGRQETTIAQAMESALRRIESGAFRDDPETELDLLSTIADILINNGRVAQAEPLLAEVLQRHRGVFPGDHPLVARALGRLGIARKKLGRGSEAEPLLIEALAMNRRLNAGDSVAVAVGLNDLASQLLESGRAAEAERHYLDALDMYRRLYPGDHESVASCLCNVAVVRHALGRYDDAEPLCVEALAMRRRLFPGDHPDVANSLTNLASTLEALNRSPEAEPLLSEALEMDRRFFKGDHPAVARDLNALASVRETLGRAAEAEPLYVESLEMYRRLFRGDHPEVARVINNLAYVRQVQGRLSEAEPLYAEALEMRRRLFKGDHPGVANSLSNLAWVRSAEGRAAEAEPLYEESLAMQRRLNAGDHPEVVRGLSNLARTRQALGKTGEARRGFDEAVAMSWRLTPEGSSDLAFYLWRSAEARLANGELPGALTELEEAVAMGERFRGADESQLRKYRETLSRCREAMARRAPGAGPGG